MRGRRYDHKGDELPPHYHPLLTYRFHTCKDKSCNCRSDIVLLGLVEVDRGTPLPPYQIASAYSSGMQGGKIAKQ